VGEVERVPCKQDIKDRGRLFMRLANGQFG